MILVIYCVFISRNITLLPQYGYAKIKLFLMPLLAYSHTLFHYILRKDVQRGLENFGVNQNVDPPFCLFTTCNTKCSFCTHFLPYNHPLVGH